MRILAALQDLMPARKHTRMRAAGVAVLLCWPAAAAAQTVISARAGLLNYTDGCVLLDGKHIEFERSRLIHLLPGQPLRTENGNAEVMLGPEVFLRLGFESEGEMASTDLGAPQVRLRNGSALIDANGLAKESPVSVLVGDIEVRLVKKGLYRLDMPPEGPHTLTVWDGQAVIVAGNRKRTISEKHDVELGESLKDLSARRVEHRKDDALDRWSSERASTIARLNGEMLRKVVEEEDSQQRGFRWPRGSILRR